MTIAWCVDGVELARIKANPVTTNSAENALSRMTYLIQNNDCSYYNSIILKQSNNSSNDNEANITTNVQTNSPCCQKPQLKQKVDLQPLTCKP